MLADDRAEESASFTVLAWAVAERSHEENA